MTIPTEAPSPAERQAAAAVVVIEPARFRSNPETRATNAFQSDALDTEHVRAAARHELDTLRHALESAGVRVHAFPGAADRALPDEVFPNNWLSTHADGTLVTYPLAAPSRRLERRADVIEALARAYRIERHLDLSRFEREDLFLESTGSLVLDRTSRVAYACRSARTSGRLVERFAAELGYEIELFAACDRNGQAIYHTNVLMSVGTRFAAIAARTIRDARERARVLERLEATGRQIVELGFAQLHAFAGNLLELEGAAGPVIALSRRAAAALEPRQRSALERHASLLVADVGTIERAGGGSVRCMLAEIHLPPRHG